MAKAGQGALLLTGPVSATAVAVDGTLQLSANNQFSGNPTVFIASDGALETGGRSETLGGLTMAGGVVDSGSGTLTLSGSLQYQQSNYTATINGNLSLGGSTRTINVTSGSAWDLMINAAISGSPGAGIVKTANTGMLTLAGANTYTGPTIVNGGYLQIGGGGSGEALASPTIALNNSDLYFSQSDTFVYSGSISGNGGVEQFGPGTAVLTGANAYTGPTVVSGGALQIGNGGGGESLASPSISNGSGLIFNQSGVFTYSGSITGGGNIVKLGPGTTVLAGSNAFTGPTTISAGTLEFAGPYAMGGGTSANITVSNNAVAAAGYPIDQTFLNRLSSASSGVAALAVSSSNNLNFNAPGLAHLSLGAIGAATYSGALTPAGTTYCLGGGGGVLTVSSSLGGANGLLVAQPGEVILTGANVYSGPTTVSGGTLEIAAPSALPSVSTTVIGSGGRLVLGSGAGIGALLTASSPNASAAVSLLAAGDAGGMGGVLAMENAPEAAATLGDATAASGVAAGAAASVPEPAAPALLLAAAAFGLLCLVRRRRAG